MGIVPDAAEVAADDQIVAGAAGKVLAPEPLKFAVRIAGHVDPYAPPPHAKHLVYSQLTTVSAFTLNLFPAPGRPARPPASP